MNNTEKDNIDFKNKRAIIFDDSQIVICHGYGDVQIDGSKKTNDIDLSHVPDNEFHEMMKAPDNFKIVKNKKTRTIERK